MVVMALLKMPARGIFDPAVAGEHELYAVIDGIAKAHLSSAARGPRGRPRSTRQASS
jgi:hypothetical protein